MYPFQDITVLSLIHISLSFLYHFAHVVGAYQQLEEGTEEVVVYVQIPVSVYHAVSYTHLDVYKRQQNAYLYFGLFHNGISLKLEFLDFRSHIFSLIRCRTYNNSFLLLLQEMRIIRKPPLM